MKLYATIQSDRATKGQGGNKFLDIKIQAGQEQKEILRILINDTPLDKSYLTARIVSITGHTVFLRSLLDQINQSLEIGKKQKGEKCYCSDDDMSIPHYH